MAWIAEEFKLKAVYADHAWEQHTKRVWPKDGQISRQAVTETIAVMQDFALITPPPPHLDSVMDQGVDQALLEAAR